MSINEVRQGSSALPDASCRGVRGTFTKMMLAVTKKMQSTYKRRNLLLLSCLLLLSQSSAALAQSAGQGGFMDALKGLVNDPMVGSFLMSKMSGRAATPSSNQAYGGAYDQSYPAPSNPMSGLSGLLGRILTPSSNYSVPTYPSQNYPSPSYSNNSPSYAGDSYPSQASSNPYAAAPNSLPSTLSSSDGSIVMSTRLAPAELKQLSRFDISVLIDRSGSMATRDCPDQFSMGRNISRWDWCREQTSMLAQQTFSAMPAGITLVPFASDVQRFPNVSPQSIAGIFNSSAPDGSTNLASALGSELDRYFNERDSGTRQRPEMIAVITDGVPDSKSAVRRVISDAESRMRNPNEVKIVFFLIGQDQSGEDFIDGLREKFPGDNGAGSLITRHSFNEVTQFGLPRSLAMSLKN